MIRDETQVRVVKDYIQDIDWLSRDIAELKKIQESWRVRYGSISLAIEEVINKMNEVMDDTFVKIGRINYHQYNKYNRGGQDRT